MRNSHLLALCLALPAAGAVSVAPLFKDNMVLQCELGANVWGTASVNEKVTISIAGTTSNATADGSGKWQITLPAIDAGGPYVLTVAASNTITINNVHFGEVWVCSGQSNMCWVAPNDVFPQEPSGKIRSYSGGQWVNQGKLAQVPWFFAKELYGMTNRPIGVIEAAQGSTVMEQWLPKGYDAAGSADAECFAKYIVPLLPLRIRGVLWWQGEGNYNAPLNFGKRMADLIKGWRARFGQGDFPFYQVQLSRIGTPGCDAVNRASTDSSVIKSYWTNITPGQSMGPWGWIRNEQRLVQYLSPNTELAVSFDIGDGDWHPHLPISRPTMGKRLALIAAARVHKQAVEYSGPVPDKGYVNGNRLILTFTHTGKGLWAKDSANGGLCEFELQAGPAQFASGHINPVSARVNGNQVEIPIDGLQEPYRVRYAWGYYPFGNLYNKDSLPGPTFFTDTIWNASSRAHPARVFIAPRQSSQTRFGGAFDLTGRDMPERTFFRSRAAQGPGLRIASTPCGSAAARRMVFLRK